MQVAETAIQFFERGARLQPNAPRWIMMMAGCHRRTGNLHSAVTFYKDIHHRFPENEDCLKCLIELCTDLKMQEARQYIAELKKIEKLKEVKDRVGSSNSIPGKFTIFKKELSKVIRLI